mmetsp:Transcript_17484/g.51008  ORF Transcript_17484/g.51008 Transcript_17484/m.51008 type:complete len:238 (+) Transcript_17484:321-1034(+)
MRICNTLSSLSSHPKHSRCHTKHCLFSRRLVVLQEPVNTLLNAILHAHEFVIRPEAPQFLVARRLLELTVGLLRIKHHLPLELHRLGHRQRHVLDGYLGRFVHAQRDGIRGVIFSHDPDGQLGEIEGVDELTQGGATAPDGEIGVVLLGEVAFVDKSRNDVTVLNREVVVGAVDVGWDDGGEVAAILLGVRAVHGIDETLGVGISLVGGVGRAVVQHRLVDGVLGLIGEDARGQHGD